MTQYLLTVHGDGTVPTEVTPQVQKMFADVEAFNTRLQQSGAWVFAGGLMPVDSATVVKVDGTMTDGPYLEAKEHIGGFWIVEAPDLDVALALAKDAAVACTGAVEVRPFQGV